MVKARTASLLFGLLQPHWSIDFQFGCAIQLLVLTLRQTHRFAAHFLGTCTLRLSPLIFLVNHADDLVVTFLEDSWTSDFVELNRVVVLHWCQGVDIMLDLFAAHNRHLHRHLDCFLLFAGIGGGHLIFFLGSWYTLADGLLFGGAHPVAGCNWRDRIDRCIFFDTRLGF